MNECSICGFARPAGSDPCIVCAPSPLSPAERSSLRELVRRTLGVVVERLSDLPLEGLDEVVGDEVAAVFESWVDETLAARRSR